MQGHLYSFGMPQASGDNSEPNRVRVGITEIFGIKNEALTLQFRGKVLGEEPLCVTMFGSDVINITDVPCVVSQRHKTVSEWATPADILHLKGQK